MSQIHPESLSSEARVGRRDGVVLRHVAGEHMLVPTVAREVDLDSLYLLNPTGVFVWEHLDGGRTVQGLGEAVARHFGIPSETARPDVARFLAALVERNLAERMDGNGH